MGMPRVHLRWSAAGILAMALNGCVYEALSTPEDPPCPTYETPPCEGTLQAAGVDAFGCELPKKCVCADQTVSSDGSCPCTETCDPCIKGSSYYVTSDATCCGFMCESCPAPSTPALACAGSLEWMTDEHDCPTQPICRCPNGAISNDGTCEAQCTEACVSCGSQSYAVAAESCCGFTCVECAAPALPTYSECKGTERPVYGEHDCVIAYECVCPDYSISLDGTCVQSCEILCASCPDNMQRVEDGSCCGTCQDDCKTCTYDCPMNGDRECLMVICEDRC